MFAVQGDLGRRRSAVSPSRRRFASGFRRQTGCILWRAGPTAGRRYLDREGTGGYAGGPHPVRPWAATEPEGPAPHRRRQPDRPYPPGGGARTLAARAAQGRSLATLAHDGTAGHAPRNRSAPRIYRGVSKPRQPCDLGPPHAADTPAPLPVWARYQCRPEADGLHRSWGKLPGVALCAPTFYQQRRPPGSDAAL